MSVLGANLTVHVGNDNWLFLERWQNVEPLRATADLGAWRQQTLPFLKLLFSSRARRCAERGAVFMAVVAPEKAAIYPDQLADPYSYEEPGAAQLLAQGCRDEGVEFIDVVPALRGARGALALYPKTDSHWTMFGAWIAYLEVAKAVERVLPIRPLTIDQIAFTQRRGVGDLGVHLIPERKSWIQSVDIAGCEPVTVVHSWDEREAVYQELVCEGGVGTALVVRNSFASQLAPYLARTFARTVLVAPPVALLDDMVEDIAPDIVIFEIAERVLFHPSDALIDWPAQSWRDLYLQSLGKPSGYLANQAARRAIKEMSFEEAVASAERACPARGDQRFAPTLATALMHAQNWPRALEVCERALADEPKSRALLYCRAKALEALRREPEAIAGLQAALALQPRNALYLYDLAHLLVRQGDGEAAITHLERAIDSAPAHVPSIRLLHALRDGAS